jgi:hypothetical protein
MFITNIFNMLIYSNLGRKCPYADRCDAYQGRGIPEDQSLSVWRNVFCNRGEKGWSNCRQYLIFEKEQIMD